MTSVDKFLFHPSKVVESENWRWQYCQQLFLSDDCLSKHTFALARKALMTTTFDAFINMLPSRFMRDGHLQPQILAVYFNGGSSIQMVDFDAILHMENKADMMFLNSELKIDTSILANETASKYEDLTWTAIARKIVNDLYHLDFEQFDYVTID